MFLGEYKHSIDLKNRVAIPAKFRSNLKTGAIITRGLDHCLFLFDRKEWIKLAEKIVNLPIAQANSRAFARLMLSGASDLQIDIQGRILIPDYLKRYANLEKQTVVAGVYNRVEIWNEAVWEKYKSRTESQSEEIAEKLGELGI